jgi:hypothetical protein
VKRIAVSIGGAAEECPVDVEQQQHSALERELCAESLRERGKQSRGGLDVV